MALSPLSPLPALNYVGLLQEKCSRNKVSFPQYSETDTSSGLFKCICTFKEVTVSGIGPSKKIAKQNAAQLMLSKLESDNLFREVENEIEHEVNAISKLTMFCQKEKKENPLFSDKPAEDGLYVVECSFDSFIAVGKGPNKKVAKEKAVDLVLKKFNIDEYFDNLKLLQKRKASLKTAVSELHELCGRKKLICTLSEETRPEGFVVVCRVGDLETTSKPSSSKKIAKMEASSLMIDLLNSSMVESSPKKTGDPQDEPLFKRVKGSE